MSTRVLLLAAMFCVAAFLGMHVAPGGSASAIPPGVAIGQPLPDFSLPDVNGRQHTLASLKGDRGTILIFIATQCPISNGYNERMEKIATDYRSRGVNVIGINSNNTEPVETVKQHAALHGFTFTILKDEGNKVADLLGAERTPEVFFVDSSGRLVYHGRIDNQRNPTLVTANDLRDAIEAILAGKPVTKTEAPAFGCSIKRV
jgi:peroxiredoxin